MKPDGVDPSPSETFGPDAGALAQLAQRSPDGIGVLDEDLRFVYVNPAGCNILGQRQEDLLGTSSLLIAPPGDQTRLGEARAAMEVVTGRQIATVVRPDGRQRELEYTTTPIEIAGRRCVAGIFRDVTEAHRTERWARAFARITSRMAAAEGAEVILGELARSAVEATGMSACAAVLFDHGATHFRIVGAHGLPGDYRRALEEALAAGLDLPAMRAFRDRTVVVESAQTDPLLATLPPSGRTVPWTTIACAPMVVGGQARGVIQGFLQPTLLPDADLLAFLDGIGDQAAVAVENVQLIAEARESARRQEALVQAGLTLALELSLPTVLTKIVQFACEVANATYGALGVLGPDSELEDFITHGVSDEERVAIGALPVGHGLLGELIHDPRPVRRRRLQEDPRSGGFPPNHPPMTTFLGVPITVRGMVYGNLYLTEKRGGPEFTEADERAVVTLAAQAGVAIENARLFSEAQQRLALEERTRLARELHDSVSQALFALTLETAAAALAIEQAGTDTTGVAHRLARLRALTEGALAEMRALIFALRPEAIREEGLVAAIRKQAEGVAAREDLEVAVHAPQQRLPLPPDVEEQLYRLTQEALSNVAKHADATHVSIRVELTPVGQLVVEIEDDGVGFDPSQPRPGHLGLRSMSERTEALGGELTLLSEPGHGTRVRAAVPIRPAPATGADPPPRTYLAGGT
jgi:PAS domain S-box-containing protein